MSPTVVISRNIIKQNIFATSDSNSGVGLPYVHTLCIGITKSEFNRKILFLFIF